MSPRCNCLSAATVIAALVLFGGKPLLAQNGVLARGRIILGISTDSGVKKLGYECRATLRSGGEDSLLYRGVTDSLGRFVCRGSRKPTDVKRLDRIVVQSDDRPPLGSAYQEVCTADYIIASGPCVNSSVTVSRVRVAVRIPVVMGEPLPLPVADTVFVTRVDSVFVARVDTVSIRAEPAAAMAVPRIPIPTWHVDLAAGVALPQGTLADARRPGAAVYLPVTFGHAGGFLAVEGSLTYVAFRPSTGASACCDRIIQPAASVLIGLPFESVAPYGILGLSEIVALGRGGSEWQSHRASVLGAGVVAGGHFAIEGRRINGGRQLRYTTLAIRLLSL